MVVGVELPEVMAVAEKIQAVEEVTAEVLEVEVSAEEDQVPGVDQVALAEETPEVVEVALAVLEDVEGQVHLVEEIQDQVVQEVVEVSAEEGQVPGVDQVALEVHAVEEVLVELEEIMVEDQDQVQVVFEDNSRDFDRVSTILLPSQKQSFLHDE